MEEQINNLINNSFGSWDATLNQVMQIITRSPADLNAAAYAMVQNIYTALLPIAYNMLALFFLIELLSKSATLEVMKWEQIAKILFKMVLAKVLIENTFWFMEAIFSISSSAITSADAASSALGGSTDIVRELKDSIPEDFLGQLGFFMSLLPNSIFMWATRAIIYVIAYGRMMEIYLLTSVAALPIATFTSAGLQSIGKKFFQNYAGVCLQGLFIMLILKLYGALALGVSLTGEGIVGKMLLTGIITVTLLVKSGTWAKQITGAA